MDDSLKITFLEDAKKWLGNPCSVDVRYLAKRDGNRLTLLNASVSFGPLPIDKEVNLHIENDFLIAGQKQYNNCSVEDALSLLASGVEGKLAIEDESFTMNSDSSPSYYTEMLGRDRWFNELHLSVFGSDSHVISSENELKIDSLLRLSTPPFDGLQGLLNFLRLDNPFSSSMRSHINLKIIPPVDLMECSLSNNNLSIKLRSHPAFDVSSLSVAAIAFPGIGPMSGQQVASKFRWNRAKAKYREAKARIRLPNADSVLVIIMVGSSMVRRQWILDPSKARNSRLLAVRQFDQDLKMIFSAVLEPIEPGQRPSERKQEIFERGVSALLFLLGFNPMIQVEKDAPDLVVVSPGGTYILVECTLRISDLHSKLGKLVERRASLVHALSSSGHQARVEAALVCALPKDKIPDDSKFISDQRIMLMSREDLESAFNNVHFPDAEKLLEDAVAKMNGSQIFQSQTR